MKGRRGLLSIRLTRIVAASAVLMLGACTRSDPHQLTFWAMGSEGDAAAKLVPSFERAHPGIHVRVQQIPWSAAHEKLLTAFVGGAMPDVFQAGNTWLPELRELHAIASLDAFLSGSRAIDRADFFAGVLDTNVIEGGTWGIPWYVDTRLVFYRRDLLEAAGVQDAPPTWDAWIDAMHRLRAKTPDSEHHAILLPPREWQVPVILALGAGGELLRDGDRFGNFRSAPVRRAFAWYLSLFQQHLAPSGTEASAGNLYQSFASGAFTFYVTGPWNLTEMAHRLPAELQSSWDTMPMPAASDGDGGPSIAGGASLAVSASTARKDDAWRLIEFLSEPAHQAELYRLTGDLPSRDSVWRALGLADAPRARAFHSQLQSVRATPKIPEWEQIAAKVGEHAEAMIRADEDLDDGLARLDRDVDRILEKRRWLLDHPEPAPGADAH